MDSEFAKVKTGGGGLRLKGEKVKKHKKVGQHVMIMNLGLDIISYMIYYISPLHPFLSPAFHVIHLWLLSNALDSLTPSLHDSMCRSRSRRSGNLKERRRSTRKARGGRRNTRLTARCMGAGGWQRNITR